MTNEQMRRDFEHWFSDEGESPQAVERAGDTYRIRQAAHAWWVWQVATLKERERCELIAANNVSVITVLQQIRRAYD